MKTLARILAFLVLVWFHVVACVLGVVLGLVLFVVLKTWKLAREVAYWVDEAGRP